jgi:transcriptional regulator TrmB
MAKVTERFKSADVMPVDLPTAAVAQNVWAELMLHQGIHRPEHRPLLLTAEELAARLKLPVEKVNRTLKALIKRGFVEVVTEAEDSSPA